jgi:hypothetical protein
MAGTVSNSLARRNPPRVRYSRSVTDVPVVPIFDRIIGIDYSGAETPTACLTGLRVFSSERLAPPVEVSPAAGTGRYWTRKGLAHWLVEQLAGDVRTLVGIDHSFSFPLQYFEAHGLARDWPSFLDDFHRHWPTDEEHMYVDFVREGEYGNGAARGGTSRWRRLAEEHARAKSVFHFDVPGQAAKSTHAGLPWLRFMRQRLGGRVHFWPFDGWALSGRSVIAEVYPRLWSHSVARDDGHTNDQHDAFAIVEGLRRAALAAELSQLFEPPLSSQERAVAAAEGWILGVRGQPVAHAGPWR